MVLAIAAGAFAICTITSYFSGRNAFFLALAADGWISIIPWAKICSHERSKFLKDLEKELHFYPNH